ncbi:F-box/RNI/FBD-like domain protein [Rhynchospora pubera]|uniref:F-box/RNI/FBD-like domain protein n=1 Tax=Rhynchospora pubera TaxID=906938 RepID=A0AAV8GZN9_9POAL|nr:F-box/RNI/FBD-like domain protein [Rhynchospora pubera]
MAGCDRISVLPLEIKISLLSHLDFKDAVRTSALAHSWRHLWTLLPRLSLSSCSDPLGLDEDEIGDFYAFNIMWMERVVNLVSSLRGPILHFGLTFYCCPYRQSDPLLQHLLHLLLQKGGVVTLHLHNFNPRYRAVICLPFFHALKELGLSDCHLVLPTGFRRLDRLTELFLVDTQISSDDLIAAKGPLSINLSFPLMRHLQFCVDDSVEEIFVISAPCLEEAFIFHDKGVNFTSEKLARITLGLVTSIVMVSSLTLGFDALKDFSLVTLPFNFTFPRLRFLSFYMNIDTVDKRMYDAFAWLLRSIPFLEELEIELQGDDSNQTNRVAILTRELLAKKHDGFACLDRSVRSVVIRMYELKVTASITMAQFFLLNAKVLKELKIAYDADGMIMPSMIEELQKLEVVSSDAEVVIFDRIMGEKLLCMNN